MSTSELANNILSPETIAFLLAISGTGPGFMNLWTRGGYRPLWFPASQPPSRIPVGWKDVYFSVNPRQAVLPEYERGRIDHVLRVGSLYGDLDIKGGWTAERVQSLHPRPSLLVDTGGGHHAYWLIDPVEVTDENRSWLNQIQSKWVSWIGGDPGARDIARVLRLPGTYNFKYEPARKVEIVFSETCLRYNLRDLAALLPSDEAGDDCRRGEDASNSQTAQNMLDYLSGEDNYSDALIDYWLDKVKLQAHIGNRSTTALFLACQLRDAGLNLNQVLPAMERYQVMVDSPANCFSLQESISAAKSAFTRPAREPAGAAKRKRVEVQVVESPEFGPLPYETTENPPTNKPKNHRSDHQPKDRRRDPTGAEYADFLQSYGYNFRLCQLDDSLWVNDERMTDPLLSEINTLLRDNGYTKVHAAFDALMAHARQHSFHPIKDFFKSLKWDGQDYISELSSYFADKHDVFPLAFRRWIVGAVARVMLDGKQNRVLVLEGPQGVGKSYLPRWLCSPLTPYFSEAMINPDDKDSWLALTTIFLWEIKELGSVTRRADREALKAFISLESVQARHPYGKFKITKPALTSFIATVNDEGGFFNDPTGSRRYMTVPLVRIDWNYAREVDPLQVWAQAYALFSRGEDGSLTSEELKRVAAINAEFEIQPPSHDWLDRYMEDCPGKFTEFGVISKAMLADDLRTDSSTPSQINSWMKKHGYERTREYVDVTCKTKDGQPKTTRKQVRGYLGVALTIPI